jgi:hypothetical protein
MYLTSHGRESAKIRNQSQPMPYLSQYANTMLSMYRSRVYATSDDPNTTLASTVAGCG